MGKKSNKKKKKPTAQDVEKIPAIKVRLDYRTVITIKDDSQLEKWKGRFPNAMIISN